MRRLRALLVASAALLMALPGPGPAAGQDPETRLTYSIGEARAYAYKVALRPEVIQAARRARPCDPTVDPYECDTTRYEHRRNCPPDITYGKQGDVPEPRVPGAAASATGGAGDGSGAEERPPQSSPIELNELLTLGHLGRLGRSVEAGGLASDSYVDLSGRQEPNAHTESDALAPNLASYEERCWPMTGEDPSTSHKHLLSRSSSRPETYHLAACYRRECTFGGPALGSSAEEGRTIVHLMERDGRVLIRAASLLEQASWGDGAFTAELIESVIEVESDGTAGGLSWTATTTLAGARMGGQAVKLPPGRILAGPDFQVGVAAPYVETAKDGTSVRIVAPGLLVATREQDAYFAGADLNAGLGRDVVSSFSSSSAPRVGEAVAAGPGTSSTSTGTAGTFAPSRSPDPLEAVAPVGTAPAPSSTVSFEVVRTGSAPVALILSLGLAGLIAVMIRWVGRFAWGRRLYRVPPLRGLDWLYRAFVKS